MVLELSALGQPSRDAGGHAGCWVWDGITGLCYAATGLKAIPQQWGSPCRHPHLPPVVYEPGESPAVCL